MFKLPQGFVWERGIIPPGRSGLFEVTHSDDPVVTSLFYNGGEIMTDRELEAATHGKVYDANLFGNVLIGGLGIGFINQFLILNQNITSVVILEKFAEVMELTWPYCKRDNRFELIIADAETWQPDRHFNFAWFDSWIQHNPLSLDEYTELMRERYSSHCDVIEFWVDEMVELGFTCDRPEGNAHSFIPVDDKYRAKT